MNGALCSSSGVILKLILSLMIGKFTFLSNLLLNEINQNFFICL